MLRRSSTFWSLVGLALGVLLGIAGEAWDLAPVVLLSRWTAPVGQLWLNALQLVVLPLVVLQTLSAIAGRRDAAATVGALGVRTLALIVALLVLGGVFTLLMGPPILALYNVDPAMVEAARSVAVPAVAADAATGGTWGAALVPANLLEAALGGNILGVLAFTVAFALAVTRLPAPQREPLGRVFTASADAMLVLVRWILVATPIGVFALMLEMSLTAGGAAVGMLAAWIMFVCGLLLVFTGLLYPLTAALARMSLRSFARAVAPAQVVAIGTRSSLAALPALIERGREQLRLPASITGFVLPLCVTIFKQNRTISSIGKLLFLAHVFGVSVSAGQIVAFFLVVLLLSFSSVGIPRGGAAFTTLPAYLAAGVPIQGVVLLETVEQIPDFFKTVLNVTADMSVAAIVWRHTRGGPAPALDQAPPPAVPEFAGGAP